MPTTTIRFSNVYRVLRQVRESGLTNMLDRMRVAEIAEQIGAVAEAAWLRSKEGKNGYLKALTEAKDPETSVEVELTDEEFELLGEGGEETEGLSEMVERRTAEIETECLDPRFPAALREEMLQEAREETDSDFEELFASYREKAVRANRYFLAGIAAPRS